MVFVRFWLDFWNYSRNFISGNTFSFYFYCSISEYKKKFNEFICGRIFLSVFGLFDSPHTNVVQCMLSFYVVLTIYYFLFVVFCCCYCCCCYLSFFHTFALCEFETYECTTRNDLVYFTSARLQPKLLSVALVRRRCVWMYYVCDRRCVSVLFFCFSLLSYCYKNTHTHKFVYRNVWENERGRAKR